ncbi:MAG: anthranilate synthase component I [Candidatus Omnitrophica bacterium]|nr:anthranilate synthase component I [Candidatus Omnitrophota bacterium]
MYYPSREEFKRLSKNGNLIPVYKELLADLETPVSAFMKIDNSEYSYLLESVEGGEKIARYSFLGSNPSLIFKSKGINIEILRKSGSKFKKKSYTAKTDPLEEIKNLISEYKFVNVEGLPRFCGGFVGYMSYDSVRFFEDIPDKNPDDLNLYDSIFVLTDTILIFDHIAHKIKVVSNVHLDSKKGKLTSGELDKIYDEAQKKIKGLVKMLQKPLKITNKSKQCLPFKVKSNLSKQAFKKAVTKAKEYIKAGDIIQTVLSQRFMTDINVKTFDIYRSLRMVNPSPYMYYLKFGDIKLIGSSPEVMLRCEKNIAEVRPIAGTRKRGRSEEEDGILSENLLDDPKERAEHIMLLDLGRNDLGRVCLYGSVHVKELMKIEKYSHVMHIVSDVQGKIKAGIHNLDVLKATFPAGTVSGAPKVRAMEIIDELETVRRGPYSGCVGYFSFSGNLDSCITIRTIIVKGKTAYVQAGAGIVADSKPEKEYQETVNKARALLKAIEIAQKGML